MFYIKWTNDDSFSELLCEIDLEGFVKREIGLDDKKRIVHKAPTKIDNYGLFDNQVFDIKNLKSNITKEYFEEYWNAEVDEKILRERVLPNKIFQSVLVVIILSSVLFIFYFWIRKLMLN